jgi:pimeloyl-ACP methyl ester carboxylesterase
VSSITLTNGTHPKAYSDLLKTSSVQRQIGKYASFFTTAGAAEYLKANQAKVLKLYHPFLAEDGPGSVSFFEEKWREPTRLQAALGIYRANLDNIIHGRVSSMKAAVPVRVYWGKNDHALVVENATRLNDYGLAGGVCELVEGGHWAFLEHLEEFCRFLEGTRVAG